MTDLLLRENDRKLDLVLEGGDLVLDPGLSTPVLASLFTDALALAEDELPGGDGDRRGWWAEAILQGEAAEVWGSRLWLLERAKLTNERLGDAEVYVREGLRWLRERGIAERVEVTASRLDQSSLLLSVVIQRGSARERAEVWEGLQELDVPVGPARLSVLAVP